MLVLATGIHRHITIDHADTFTGFVQGRTAMHHHITVQCDGIARSVEWWRFHTIDGWCFTFFRQFCHFVFGADEILKLPAIQCCRISNHHHYVKWQSVVVPLVNRLRKIRW